MYRHAFLRLASMAFVVLAITLSRAEGTIGGDDKTLFFGCFYTDRQN